MEQILLGSLMAPEPVVPGVPELEPTTTSASKTNFWDVFPNLFNTGVDLFQTIKNQDGTTVAVPQVQQPTWLQRNGGKLVAGAALLGGGYGIYKLATRKKKKR